MARRKIPLKIQEIPINPDLQIDGLGMDIIVALDAIDTAAGSFKEPELRTVLQDLQDLCKKHSIPVPKK